MAPVGLDDHQMEVVERELEGHSFESAEARWEYERTRRIRVVLKITGGIIFLAVFGWGMYYLGGGGAREQHGDDDGHNHSTGGGPSLNIDPVGKPSAKVQVNAILPSGSDCHSEIIKFLSTTAQKWPDNIYVTFQSMDELTNDQIATKVGSVCAALLVNNSTEHTVMLNGEPKGVSLIGTTPTHYTLGDVGLVISKVFKDHYGDPGEPIVEVPKGQEARCDSETHAHADLTKPGTEATDDGKETKDLLLPSFKAVKPTSPPTREETE